jgi:hypothetical protein
MTNGSFVPALELNEAFYREVVSGLLGDRRHAAALLGWGSDVLGYDTDRSTDHGWGPRLQLFVTDEESVEDARKLLAAELPGSFRGWPVTYGWDESAAEHRVEVSTLGSWLTGQLGVDPRDGLSAIDWLTIPQQRLLGVVRGAVYADPAHRLQPVRDLLARFPPDVRRWLLACQWQRISQEIAFVGRAAEVGDELGSRMLAGRLVQELMRLVFLQTGTYWPYSKWFGTAFAELPDAEALVPILSAAVAATDYPAREGALVQAYRIVAERQNDLGLAEPVDWSIGPYFSRPFLVVHGEFVEACLAGIEDDRLRGLPLVGSVDQFVDSTDVLSDAWRARKLRAFYERI